MTVEDTGWQSAAVCPDNVPLNQSTANFLFSPVPFKAMCGDPALFFHFSILSQSSGIWSELPNQRIGWGLGESAS